LGTDPVQLRLRGENRLDALQPVTRAHFVDQDVDIVSHLFAPSRSGLRPSAPLVRSPGRACGPPRLLSVLPVGPVALRASCPISRSGLWPSAPSCILPPLVDGLALLVERQDALAAV